MRQNQQKLIDAMAAKGGLLSDEELVDFYIQHVQRKSCKIGVFIGDKPKDYGWDELLQMSKTFALRAIGRLVVDGGAHVYLSQNHTWIR